MAEKTKRKSSLPNALAYWGERLHIAQNLECETRLAPADCIRRLRRLTLQRVDTFRVGVTIQQESENIYDFHVGVEPDKGFQRIVSGKAVGRILVHGGTGLTLVRVRVTVGFAFYLLMALAASILFTLIMFPIVILWGILSPVLTLTIFVLFFWCAITWLRRFATNHLDKLAALIYQTFNFKHIKRHPVTDFHV